MSFELQIDLDNINNSHVLLFQCNGFPIDDEGPAYSINSDGYYLCPLCYFFYEFKLLLR